MSNTTLYRPAARQSVTPLHTYAEFRTAEVQTALRLLGADEYDMVLPETRFLPHLLRADETIFGVVYGKYKKFKDDFQSRGMLVVTDQRVLLINKKPLYLHYDEIGFDSLRGIKYGHAAFGTTITLSTRIGDIVIRTFNSRCAAQFVNAIEDVLCGIGRVWGYDYRS